MIKEISVYIHIPFCMSICSYCDFSKFLYNEEWANKYLNSLEKEIRSLYKNELVKTIYIGGGTPSSLNINQLEKLFKILQIFKTDKNIEFTFECNIENINKEKLELLYENNVNRLSIGIQTFNKEQLKFLNRNHIVKEISDKVSLIKSIGFNNINVDLMYALPNQTIDDLDFDLNEFLKLDINHISTYSLMIEPNTLLNNKKYKNIDEDLDYNMYQHICKKLKDNKFNHYEVSNFAKKGYESKHNLTYWNNEEYYGFGIGASSYIDNNRYDNTRSFNDYINDKYKLMDNKIDNKEKMENEFILGLRKIKGINKDKFKEKYNIDIESIKVVKDLLNTKELLQNKKHIYINPKYIYVSNNILTNFINF